jgi:hypothetical protein
MTNESIRVEAPKCFVCGESDRPLKLKRFCCLWYWLTELTCQRCFEIETAEPREGTWTGPDAVRNL